MRRGAAIALLATAPSFAMAENESPPSEPPRAQALGKDQSGVFVNGSVANSGASPNFVMRGFPGGLTLFDGAAHGYSSQEVDLSTVDHVEFFKGPSSMLFGKAPGGYGGAANYIRKTPTGETFARGVATLGSFEVFRANADVNAPLSPQKNVTMRVIASMESARSFVNFVRSRSFDIAPMIAFDADNGDRLTLRAEHNAARLVYRDGVPTAPVFLYVPREFYAGAPANEHESPHYTDLTLTHRHHFAKDWKLTTLVDFYLSSPTLTVRGVTGGMLAHGR